MKRNALITAALLLIFSTAVMAAQEKDKQELSTVRFETSIDCENCVKTIMKNIPFIKGVKDVKCDLPTKEVTIQYQKGKADPEQLKRAIEKLGYTAKEIKDKEKEKEKTEAK